MERQNCKKVTRYLLTVLAAVVLMAAHPLPTSPLTYVEVKELPETKRFFTLVTAYSSSPDETDGDPWITASGERVRDGIVACSREYPFGTRLIVDGDVYVCLDRLAPRYDSRVDIWMPSKEEALTYGIRETWVEVLTEPEPTVQTLLSWNDPPKVATPEAAN